MVKHKVFIAVNLPENIKNHLLQYQEKFIDLPARWTKKENLHITMEFLGYLSDEEIIELCQKTEKIVSQKQAFLLFLNKICYAPLNKKVPTMIWAIGPKIKQFNITPHVTLARIRRWELRQIELEQRPQINEEISPDQGGINFRVKSIEIMESRLKRGGPEYLILKSIKLKDN